MPSTTVRPTYFSSAGRSLTTFSPSVSDWLPTLATYEPLFCSIVASTMFIAGEPMNPPTNRFTGCSYSSCGRRDLLQLPLAHDRDAVAHRHRLDLVVRHVDRRHAELALEARDLGAHVDPELRVQVRERLVHEIGLRLADDRAAHRHALALATGERARLPVEELLQSEDAGSVPDALVDLVLGLAPQAQSEGDVLVDREVRVERVALEDHRDVAVACGHVVDDPVADLDGALADLLEARDHAQRSRLAAAGGTDEDHELSVGDLEVHVSHGARAVRIDLADVTERHARQMFLPG